MLATMEHHTTDDGASHLAGLTGPQHQAVEHVEGPLLVLAAAGSGKTRVITRRIAHLIDQGVAPWSILALTFTNKAAAEMRERIATLLGDDPRLMRGLTVSTFHALCARLLRRYADDAGVPGLTRDFTIYPSADQAALMKRVLSALDLSSTNWPPRSVLSAISNAKNELLGPKDFAARAGDFYAKQIARIYEAYERGLREAGAVDFDDLLLLTATMLRDQPTIREDCQSRWSFLLIDEYQDTNHAQLLIASLIAGQRRPTPGMPGEFDDPNICVVGDPDQSIYGWRGADINNILEFEEHYPSARVITLGENFRSTEPILACADALIRHNKQRKHKDLFTSTPGGEPVEVLICRDERHEAELVADWFSRLADPAESGDTALAWKDMAVFYRTNALSRVMEDSLRERGIPYTIARGTAFYERQEIRHALAYLRVIANPADAVSLGRIVNVPTRGIGKTSLARLDLWAQDTGVGLMDAMRRAREIDSLGARAQGAMARFVTLIDDLTGHGSFMGAELTDSLADLVERVIRESGLEKMYEAQARASKSEADAERLDNLAELVSSAAQFEHDYQPDADPLAFPGARALEQGEPTPTPPLLAMLRAYLESVALVADADQVDPARGAITLMTLHAAKGLEFPAAAIIGLEDGLLPHSRARESESDMEEERRLCFVGITRAMRRLLITTARFRTIRGITERTIQSRFLDELDADHTLVTDRAGYGVMAADAVPDPGVRAVMSSGAMAEAKSRFPPGCLVRHPQFGVGTVVDISGGTMARARVEFREAGTKTLILEYARLTRLGG